MRRARGFSLLEMLVAIAIGSAAVVAAAKIATVVVVENNKTRQKTNQSNRTRLLTRQLRSDIRAAGTGSTGAIAVSPGNPTLMAMASPTPAGFFAMAAVTGANNLPPLPVGGEVIRQGSDAMQIVVPNGANSSQTTLRAESGTQVLTFLDAAPFQNCQIGYIADHSAPNGAGRTHIFFIAATAPTTVTTAAPLAFTVAPGSDVMCARISSYWLDNNGWMHRTDLTPGGALLQLGGSRVFVDTAVGQQDVLAPGIQDLQFSYRVSRELYRQLGVPVPAQVSGRWAFTGQAPNASGLMVAPTAWFEVRMLRASVLARNLKRVKTDGQEYDSARREDGPGNIEVLRSASASWITASESLTNLRYFDLGGAEGVAAEPY